jgi:hypothetical protein
MADLPDIPNASQRHTRHISWRIAPFIVVPNAGQRKRSAQRGAPETQRPGASEKIEEP